MGWNTPYLLCNEVVLNNDDNTLESFGVKRFDMIWTGAFEVFVMSPNPHGAHSLQIVWAHPSWDGEVLQDAVARAHDRPYDSFFLIVGEEGDELPPQVRPARTLRDYPLGHRERGLVPGSNVVRVVDAMTISVALMSGRECQLKVAPQDTVDDVRALVCGIMEIPWHEQVLSLRGQLLPWGRRIRDEHGAFRPATLGYYRVHDGDVLLLVRSERGVAMEPRGDPAAEPAP